MSNGAREICKTKVKKSRLPDDLCLIAFSLLRVCALTLVLVSSIKDGESRRFIPFQIKGAATATATAPSDWMEWACEKSFDDHAPHLCTHLGKNLVSGEPGIISIHIAYTAPRSMHRMKRPVRANFESRSNGQPDTE